MLNKQPYNWLVNATMVYRIFLWISKWGWRKAEIGALGEIAHTSITPADATKCLFGSAMCVFRNGVRASTTSAYITPAKHSVAERYKQMSIGVRCVCVCLCVCFVRMSSIECAYGCARYHHQHRIILIIGDVYTWMRMDGRRRTVFRGTRRRFVSFSLDPYGTDIAFVCTCSCMCMYGVRCAPNFCARWCTGMNARTYVTRVCLCTCCVSVFVYEYVRFVRARSTRWCIYF